MKKLAPRFPKWSDDNPYTINSTVSRYFIWIFWIILVAFLGTLLTLVLFGRSEFTEAQDMHYDFLAVLCVGLPVVFFALFFLFYKREDPCKARFYGILCGLLLLIFTNIFVPVHNAYYIAKAARLSVDIAAFRDEMNRDMNIFTISMLVFTAALYFIGPFRLLMKERRQRKKTAEDFGIH